MKSVFKCDVVIATFFWRRFIVANGDVRQHRKYDVANLLLKELQKRCHYCDIFFHVASTSLSLLGLIQWVHWIGIGTLYIIYIYIYDYNVHYYIMYIHTYIYIYIHIYINHGGNKLHIYFEQNIWAITFFYIIFSLYKFYILYVWRGPVRSRDRWVGAETGFYGSDDFFGIYLKMEPLAGKQYLFYSSLYSSFFL